MKKYSIILMGFLWVASPVVHAQTADAPRAEQRLMLSGGPIIESNLSGFFHSGIEGGNSRMRAGVSAGGFLDLGIQSAFSVQGTLLFHMKRSDFILNPRRGIYFFVREAFYPHWLSSHDRNIFGTTLTFDAFVPVWRGGILAFDLYGQLNGDDVPGCREKNWGQAPAKCAAITPDATSTTISWLPRWNCASTFTVV